MVYILPPISNFHLVTLPSWHQWKMQTSILSSQLHLVAKICACLMMSGELLFYFSAHGNIKTQRTQIESRSKNQLIMIKCMHFRFAQSASRLEY